MLPRAKQTARRKAIYLELHPETGHGKATANKDDNLSSFAVETAAAIGKDKRTVQRDAERGEKVIPEARPFLASHNSHWRAHGAENVAFLWPDKIRLMRKRSILREKYAPLWRSTQGKATADKNGAIKKV